VCNDNNPCTADQCRNGTCRFTRIAGCSPKLAPETDLFTNPVVEAKEVVLMAYPNPFSDKLNIEFTLQEDSRATIEIYNIAGQKIAVLFDGQVNANQLQRVEFNATQSEQNMFIYRLQTETNTYYGKAIGVK